MIRSFSALKPAKLKMAGKIGALSAIGVSALYAGMPNIAPLSDTKFVRTNIAFAQDAQTSQDTPPSDEIVKQPGVPLLSFDVKNLGPLLTEMKILWQERKAPDGSPFILANADGDTVFILSPLSCNPSTNTQCLGLQLVSVFDGQANQASVLDFNNRYAFANMNINESGNAYLSRYDIADYGIARGNVATIVQTFIGLSRIYQNSFSEDVQASNTIGESATDGDDAIIKITSYTPPRIRRSQQKTRLFEAGNNLSSIFTDDALPTNKIRNIDQ